MQLIRGIDRQPPRQAIVAAILGLARALGIAVIAEGVESEAELRTLQAAGATLFQGYHFAKPSVGALPSVPGISCTGALSQVG